MITNPLDKIKYYTYCKECGEKVEVSEVRDMEIKEFEFDPKSYLFDMDVKSKCGIPGFIGVIDNKTYQS